MHSLPPDFDPSFMRDERVESVSFTEYQIFLYLSGQVTIQIERGYELSCTKGIVEVVEGFPISSSMLPSVIGRSVIRLHLDRCGGSLALDFDNEVSLRLLVNEGPYESYRIISQSVDVVV